MTRKSVCTKCKKNTLATYRHSECGQVTITKTCENSDCLYSTFYTIPENVDEINFCEKMNQLYAPVGVRSLIFELTDDCNTTCPTCIAGSYQGAGNYQTINAAEAAAKTAVLKKTFPFFLSGGEPTIHPNFLEILDKVIDAGIDYPFIISNGIRFAEDCNFCEEISRRRVHVFLQFDSLDESVIKEIRGHDLLKTRLQAITNLQKFNVPVTLICVVKNNLNDKLLSDVIDFGMNNSNIVGVVFQPIKFSGRVDKKSDYRENSMSINQIINSVNYQRTKSDCFVFSRDPWASEFAAHAYFERSHRRTINWVNDILEMNSKPMYMDNYYNQMSIQFFRISVVNYMDAFSFSYEQLQRSPIGFIVKSDIVIPLDSYYLHK